MSMPKYVSQVQEELELLDILNGRLPGRGAAKRIAALMRINALVNAQLATAIPDPEPPPSDEQPADGQPQEGSGRKRGKKSEIPA